MPGRVVSAAPHAPPAGSPARRSAPRCPSRDHARGPDREAPPLRRGYSRCLSPDRRNECTPSDAVRLRRAAIRPAYLRGSRRARRQMLRKSCQSSSSFQCPSQKKSRAVKLRFASARGDPTQLRDLLVLVPFNVVEHEDVSRSWRQLGNRVCEVHSLYVHRRPRNFSPPFVADIAFISSRGFLALGLSRIQNHVDRETMQPGRKSALTPELWELFPGSHEYVLCQLLALRPAAAHPGAQRIHPVGVRPVQPLECLAVPGRG